MKKIYALLVLGSMLLCTNIFAQCTEPSSYGYQTVKDGDWSDAATWAGGAVPPKNYNGNILITHTVSNGASQVGTATTVVAKDGGVFGAFHGSDYDYSGDPDYEYDGTALEYNYDLKCHVILLNRGRLVGNNLKISGTICASGESAIISTHDFQFGNSASISLYNSALAVCHDFNTTNAVVVSGTGMQINIGHDFHAVDKTPQAFDGGQIDQWYVGHDPLGKPASNWPDMSSTPLCDCNGNGLFVTPVTLTKFSAAKQKNTVLLQWNTASEINNQGFDVERGTDSKTFIKIGYAAAKSSNGNSNISLDYDYTDNAPILGANSYYRLKQVDKDGRYDYSDIAIVRAAQGSAPILYPNPAHDYIYIGNAAIGSMLRIVGADGKIYRATTITGSSQKIDLTNMPSGLYFVKIEKGNTIIASDKFVKQ